MLPDKPRIPPVNPNGDASDSAEFMRSEYETMRGLKDQSVSVSDRRVDLHLGLTTAVAGGFVLLAQTSITTVDLFVVIVLGSAGLLLLGLTTFRLVIDRDILTVDYIRAANRIRAYFVERDASIEKYLLMPTTSTYPPYGWHSSSRTLTLALNGLALGVLVMVGLMLQQQRTTLDFNDLWIGVAAGVVIYLVQWGYAKIMFLLAEHAAREDKSVNLHRAAKSR